MLDIRMHISVDGQPIKFNRLPDALRAIQNAPFNRLKEYNSAIRDAVSKKFWPWKIRAMLKMWHSRRANAASGAGAGERDIDGSSTYWAPLKQSYRRWKRTKYLATNGRIGKRGFWIHTGAHEADLKSRVRFGAKWSRRPHNAWKSTFGPNPALGYVFDVHSGDASRNLPPRPFYFFTKVDAIAVNDIVKEAIARVAKKAARKTNVSRR